MYGECMTEEVKPVNMHVKFPDPDEYERVKKMKGAMDWRPWLLTLPDQFRNLTDRIELWKRRAEDYERENAELKERIKTLQEKIGDA